MRRYADFEFRTVNLGESFSDVVAAAKLGKEWAWASLYRAISGPVTGYFRARGVADPTDLAGDVFFELARSISRFEGDESAFRTYVFVVAHRRLGESQNSSNNRRSVLADDILDVLQAERPFENLDEDDSISEDVRAAFAILSPEQRDVLSLRIIAGLTVQETAAVINLGIGQIKAIQRRGLSKVRDFQAMPGTSL